MYEREKSERIAQRRKAERGRGREKRTGRLRCKRESRKKENEWQEKFKRLNRTEEKSVKGDLSLETINSF
jgi:hypothetical protein